MAINSEIYLEGIVQAFEQSGLAMSGNANNYMLRLYEDDFVFDETDVNLAAIAGHGATVLTGGTYADAECWTPGVDDGSWELTTPPSVYVSMSMYFDFEKLKASADAAAAVLYRFDWPIAAYWGFSFVCDGTGDLRFILRPRGIMVFGEVVP